MEINVQEDMESPQSSDYTSHSAFQLMVDEAEKTATGKKENNLFFKQNKELEEQQVVGFLVQDSKGEAFVKRYEFQSEEEQKSLVVGPEYKGAKLVYYFQLLVIKSPNAEDVGKVRLIQIKPAQLKELTENLKGDVDLGEERIDPYVQPIPISFKKTGKKLNTRYSITVGRNAKVKYPATFERLDSINKILDID